MMHTPFFKKTPNPFGFFALSLLIIEGFLGGIVIAADLSVGERFIGMLAGVGVFLLVILLMFALAFKNARNTSCCANGCCMCGEKPPKAHKPLAAKTEGKK